MHMKQKVSIWSLPIRLGLFCLLLFIPQLLGAQENNDSVRMARDNELLKPTEILPHSTIDLLPEKEIAYPVSPTEEPGRMPRLSLNSGIYIPYHVNPSPLFKGDYSTNGVLHQFAHGTLFGSGSQTSLAGIGRFNNATLGYQHVFNEKFELQVRANAMKINMSHITGQAFSTSGAMSYHVSDRISLNLFGSYYLGNSYGMNTNSYGASMTVNMSERFSMEMGVQRYYNAMSGKWEIVPVVIPTYKFKKLELGLDVGAILYEVLREAVFDNRQSSGPTMAPPRLSLPIR